VKYTRFEELPAWNAAIELAVGVYKLTADRSLLKQRAFRDQLERAAVSVSNNIAEGFERGTKQELLTFLYIARGSAGEVRSMLCLLERLPHSGNLKFEISNLKSQIACGGRFSPATWLGGFFAGKYDQGPALSDSEGSPNGTGSSWAGAVAGEASSGPKRSLRSNLNLKSQISNLR
jgi:four helix bundle protein